MKKILIHGSGHKASSWEKTVAHMENRSLDPKKHWEIFTISAFAQPLYTFLMYTYSSVKQIIPATINRFPAIRFRVRASLSITLDSIITNTTGSELMTTPNR